MCSLHKEKGTLAPLHVCQKNWEGSAKSMEADIGVALVKEVEKKGVKVDVLVMDDDKNTDINSVQTYNVRYF